MSLLQRSFQRGQPPQPDPEPSPGRARQGDYFQPRHAIADFTEADDDDDDDSNEEEQPRYGGGDDNEDGMPQSGSVLPLYSSSHLDSLPVYTVTHAIRIIVQARTETTLTWEQLRSPQVSQFLVKPMQQQIRAHHFSTATLYALMANCLQFAKERQLYPGNAGTSSTRSKVCELLAIKLLKEYSTRELIDALSYDFYPLRGIPGSISPITAGGKGKQSVARTSTLEVAIRASAKHFLAHPLVVQQLEAIWSGAISFYSSADTLHRRPSTASPVNVYRPRRQSDQRTPLLANQQPGKEEPARYEDVAAGRRTATLYDPRNASLFKLSRLRVPRYRQILSTCSLAILIGLFLAVLVQRSQRITSLELVFWFWSAGFMLDELVGFTEQGFSLYIMSFWNIFDLGILLLLIVYYCMRIYGVFVVDAGRWNDNAYDVLAANAILLLPRIFSVLDHYQYFSQLLIAFRLMALDLAAVFVLVLISCSGFFVFFTLSTNNNGGAEVAYKIFQILMGFTPAAWEVWPKYDWLGKALMGLFLIICHFVVVTILITVLTNSFMSIASNASEEHQFLFAINTISEIKNDALFSYVAPGNIFAWALMPLRYCMPLRQFVWLNRFVIKVTHFPLLFCIYAYERYFLGPSMYDPTDLVENPGRGRRRAVSLADPASRTALFSPSVRVREGSVAGFQKDRALEEVFRRAPDFTTLRTQRRNERRKTQNAIRTWMDQHEGGYAHSPQNYSTVDSRSVNEWQRRLSVNRDRSRRFRHFSDARSAASDPADLLSNAAFPLAPGFYQDGISRRDYATEVKDNTDADGDDELVTNDEEEDNATNAAETDRARQAIVEEDETFATPVATRFTDIASTTPESTIQQPQKATPSPRAGPSRRRGLHNRTMSTNTILYAPQEMSSPYGSPAASAEPTPNTVIRPPSNRQVPVESSPAVTTGRRSPRRSVYPNSRGNPILPARDVVRTAFSRTGAPNLDIPARQSLARRRSSSVDQDPSSELNAAMADDALLGAVPASFATQMAMAVNPLGMARSAGAGGSDRDYSSRMSRLMLAKMKTLEEGLGDVVREMRVLRSAVPSTAHNSGDDGGEGGRLHHRITRKGRPHSGVGSGSASGSTGPPAVVDEMAERDARGGPRRPRVGAAAWSARTVEERPASRRSLGLERVGIRSHESREKRKGKAVAMSDADAEDHDGYGSAGFEEDIGFTRKGSSF